MKKRILVAFLALTMLLSGLSLAPIQTQAASSEYKGVWFAYYDYENYLSSYSKNNSGNFTKYFDKVLNNCKAKGFNTIIVHVRAFGDAYYKSKYFPTAASIAGKQGASLSYDPLKIMVKEAHKKGL